MHIYQFLRAFHSADGRNPELSMGWVNLMVGLGWVEIFFIFGGMGWIVCP